MTFCTKIKYIFSRLFVIARFQTHETNNTSRWRQSRSQSPRAFRPASATRPRALGKLTKKARGLWVRDCGLWDNQQPEARFLASGLKADTADPREGWESTEKAKRKGNLHPSRLPIIAIHWKFLENKTTQTNAVNDLGLFAI